MKELHVGRGVNWPATIAAQAIGVLGMRGAGKSNLGRVYAEELFAAGIPFVVFDPIGNWYGIRAGRDGKPGGGIPVPIFGGAHGDLDLTRGSGAQIADLILDRRLSAVLDLSHADFSEADKRRFLVDFGERLFRKKTAETGWLTLIMEEADDYAPQSTRGPQIAECLGMFQRLVKRGRFKGLGALMITQRSAAINKDLLYMVGTLVVFRTTGPRDQEAVAGWVKHNAIGEDLVGSLPNLEDGQAWVIAQEALGTIERVAFRRMTTYDTGATPEHGGDARPATLADIDVPTLRTELSAAAERRKAEDPAELRRRIAALERELKTKPVATPARNAEPKPREVPILKDAHVKRLEAAIERLLADTARMMDQVAQRQQVVVSEAGNLRAQITAAVAAARPPAPAGRGIAALIPDRPVPERRVVAPPPRPARAAAESNGDIPPARQRILDALAWLQSVNIQRADRTQLALLADASPTSSAFANNLGSLRTAGLIDYAGPGEVVLTTAGAEQARADDAPSTPGEVQRAVLSKLSPAKGRILQALIAAYPKGVPRADLADQAGASATSSAYANNLGSLRSLGLIDYRGGEVVARRVLFLEA